MNEETNETRGGINKSTFEKEIKQMKRNKAGYLLIRNTELIKDRW